MTITTFHLQRAMARYRRGRTLAEIAQDERCAINTVWRRLRAAGVELRKPGGVRRAGISPPWFHENRMDHPDAPL